VVCLLAQAHAVKRSINEGLAFVPPYDDPHTIAGQGTIGDEILRQASGPLLGLQLLALVADPSHFAGSEDLQSLTVESLAALNPISHFYRI
jgi:hypothetical protein